MNRDPDTPSTSTETAAPAGDKAAAEPAAPAVASDQPEGIRGWIAHLLLLLLGGAMWLVLFPRIGVQWMGWVALVPWGLLAARSARPGRMTLLATAVFFGWWAVMVPWLQPVTGPGYLGVALVMAVWWVAALWAARLLHRTWRLPMALALPLGWVTIDFLRGHQPFDGFSWFTLAHTQGNWRIDQDAVWVAQIADLLGQHLIGFVLAAVSGLIVDLLVRPPMIRVPVEGSTRGRVKLRPGVATVAVLTVLGAAGSLAYGAWRVAETRRHLTPGPAVAVTQTNVPQSNKNNPKPQQVIDDFLTLQRLILDAGGLSPRPDVVVTPETVVPATLNAEALQVFRAQPERGGLDSVRVFEIFDSLARELGDTPIIVGAHGEDHWKHRAAEGEHAVRGFYDPARRNAAYLIDGKGKAAPAHHYYKMRLVPFGEYIPDSEAFPWFKRLVLKHFSPYEPGHDYSLTPGTSAMRFPFAIRRAVDVEVEPGVVVEQLEVTGYTVVGVPICFEDVEPEICRWMIYNPDGSKQGDALINITNDGWFAGTPQGPQHLQVASLRCIENRVPMARSVNTGISGFIDSLGRVSRVVEVNGEQQRVAGVASHRLMIDRRSTVFGSVGEGPWWWMMWGVLWLCAAAVAWTVARGGWRLLFGRRKGREPSVAVVSDAD